MVEELVTSDDEIPVDVLREAARVPHQVDGYARRSSNLEVVCEEDDHGRVELPRCIGAAGSLDHMLG